MWYEAPFQTHIDWGMGRLPIYFSGLQPLVSISPIKGGAEKHESEFPNHMKV